MTDFDSVVAVTTYDQCIYIGPVYNIAYDQCIIGLMKSVGGGVAVQI